MSYKGIASEKSSAAADIETITGDTGGSVGPDGSFNVNLVGGGGLSVDGNPGTNTLTINPPIGSAPITEYVVAQDGSGDYTTIQAALDAANAAGGGSVWVKPATYTENLTFYDKTELVGAVGIIDIGAPKLIGVHTPPSSGTMGITNFLLQSATDIFNSSASGSALISLFQVITAVADGWVYNLPNWTGDLKINDAGSFLGTNDGFVNNGGGATIFTNNCQIGAGTTRFFTANGDIRLDLTFLDAPSTLAGANLFINFALFSKKMTLSSTTQGDIVLGDFFTGSDACIDFNTSGNVNLKRCSLSSTNDPAITGTGSGTLILADTIFINNSNISSSLTIQSGVIKGGNFTTQYVVDPTGESGAYKTIQAAIDAASDVAGDVVYVMPGIYNENLSFYAGTFVLTGSLGVTIDGTHSPAAASSLTLNNLTLISVSGDILNSSASAGNRITISNCFIGNINGYLMNMPNWNGKLQIHNTVNGALTQDGIINNLANADVEIYDSVVGGGSSFTFTAKGNVNIYNSVIDSLVSISDSNTLLARNSFFKKNVTISSSSKLECYQCLFSTGSAQAITYNSFIPSSILSDTTIDSTNNPAIGGTTPTGSLDIGSVTFLNNENIAVTVPVNEDVFLQTGELIAKNVERQTFSGFYQWDGGGPFYSTSGTNFTVVQSGFGYIKSRKVTWAGSQTVSSLSAGNTHYIYIDNTGTIGSTITRSSSLFEDNIVLFEVLVDSAGTPNLIVTREDHPYSYSTGVSNWAHDAIFTKISNLDKGANITLNGTKAIEIVGADKLLDHGIETAIPDSGGSPETFQFMYTNASNKWIRNTSATLFPSEWNNAGTITALGANKFAVFTLYVGKDDLNSPSPKFYAVYDTSQYNSVALALAAIAAETVAIADNELLELEIARLGYVVKKEFDDTINNVIIDKQTLNATKYEAWQICTNTSNFDGILSSSDQTVQMALETIDNFYETGTFTPNLEFGGSSTGITYNVQSGRYTKIGDIVFICLEIDLSNKGTATGSAKINGLPFTIDTKTSHVFGRWENIDLSLGTGYTTLIGTFGDGDIDINVQEVGDNVAKQSIDDGDFNNNSELLLVANYHV